jgi:hypothetical protein
MGFRRQVIVSTKVRDERRQTMVSPLRPELYNRLLARFGGVRIGNEGEEMVADVDTDPCTGRLRLRVQWPGEYYRVCCPYCGDSRYRLWINHGWGLYVPALQTDNLWLAHCYNAHCLARPGRASELRDLLFSGFARGHDPDPVRPGRRLTGPLRPGQYRPAGPDLVPLHELAPTHQSCVFVRGRGYDPGWLSREYGVCYCHQAYPEFAMASGRLIIPLTFRGVPSGWQSRYLGTPPHGVPRHFSMPGMKKREILYNYDEARKHSFVVLVEGPSKAWSTGPESVALLGCSISSYQAQLIALGWRTVLIYLDGSAIKESTKVFEFLDVGPGKRVLVRLPPGKEPGDFDRRYNRLLLYEAARRQGVDLPQLLRDGEAPVRGDARSGK